MCIRDRDTGTVLYEKNADEQVPIASITKVMTLLLTFEAVSYTHLDVYKRQLPRGRAFDETGTFAIKHKVSGYAKSSPFRGSWQSR